jgi:hypothetical protein
MSHVKTMQWAMVRPVRNMQNAKCHSKAKPSKNVMGHDEANAMDAMDDANGLIVMPMQ